MISNALRSYKYIIFFILIVSMYADKSNCVNKTLLYNACLSRITCLSYASFIILYIYAYLFVYLRKGYLGTGEIAGKNIHLLLLC